MTAIPCSPGDGCADARQPAELSIFHRPAGEQTGRYVVPRDRDQLPEFLAQRGEQLGEVRRQFQRKRSKLIAQCLLVDAREAGSLVGIDERTWRRLDARGQVPAPIKVGKSARWPLRELAKWIQAGCPNRETWEAR